MIQVQIASQITPSGVQGIRWVLVDPADSCNATGPQPADGLIAAVALAVEPSTEGSLLTLGALKLGLTGLGLGLALWTAQAWLGAPTAPWLAPTADPQPAARAAVLPPMLAVPTPALPAASQPAPTPPQDAAAPAETAASATAAFPRVTAELR